MFAIIYHQNHVALGFSFLAAFWLLIQSSYWLWAIQVSLDFFFFLIEIGKPRNLVICSTLSNLLTYVLHSSFFFFCPLIQNALLVFLKKNPNLILCMCMYVCHFFQYLVSFAFALVRIISFLLITLSITYPFWV